MISFGSLPSIENSAIKALVFGESTGSSRPMVQEGIDDPACGF
jgi:hypothetical protein